MPTAPSYGQEKVAPTALPGARLTAVPTADTFGASAGEAIAKAGVGVYGHELQLANEMRIEELTNQLHDERRALTFGKPGENPGFLASKGSQVLPTERESEKPLSVEYIDEFDKRAERVLKSAGNDFQRTALQKRARLLRDGLADDVSKHERAQTQAHYVAIAENTQRTELNNAATRYESDDEIALARARFEMSVDRYAELHGYSGETLAQYRAGRMSDLHKAVIATALGDNKLGRAQAYFEQNQKEIDAGDRIAIQANLRETTKRVEVEAWDAVGRGITESENRIFSDPTNFRAEHEAQTALINNLPDVSEKLRLRMKKELDTRLSTARELGLAEVDPVGTAARLRGKQGPVIEGATTVDRVASALKAAEGSGSNAVSPQGATGSMQIMPATFKQYAKPGESYDNEADRVAAAKRKIEDDYAFYGGDVAKVAAAYIGGRGAVRADGTIRDDVRDAHGTTPKAYAEKVVRSLGLDRPPSGPDVSDLRASAADSVPRPEWGKRQDGTAKGAGFLGALRAPDGSVVTEYTIGVKINGKQMDVPTLVPTLTRAEVEQVLRAAGDPTGKTEISREIERKAADFARLRVASGKSVFVEASDVAPPRQPSLPRTGDPSIDSMPLEQRFRLLRQVETRVHQQQGVERQQLQGKLQDFTAMAQTGAEIPASSIPQEAAFRRAFGDVEGARLYAETVPPALQLNADVKEVMSMPNDQHAALLASRAPRPGDTYAEDLKRAHSLQQAIQRVQKQREDDPAAFVLTSSPQVRKAFEATQEAGKSKDPVAIRLAYANYADAVTAAQTRLGIPQALLTKPMAENIVRQFYEQKEGGQNAAQLIQTLSAQWGKNWNAVYGQIAKQIPSAARTIGAGMPEGAAMLLAGVADFRPEELKKGLPADMDKDIKNYLDKHFEEGRISLVATNPRSGNDTYNSIFGDAEKLALVYVRAGKSPKEAAKQAYDDTFGHRYEIVKSGPAAFRVPKGQDASAIASGADVVRANVGTLDLQLPASRAGLDAKQIKAAWVDQLRTDSYWVTAPDESGLTLYNANGAAVLDSAGRPVWRSWYALQRAGETGSITGQPPAKGTPGTFNSTGAGAATGSIAGTGESRRAAR